ncbi:MAG: cell division topological specificity factor MinE [Capsulimonadales bacterium]|nr:cell division topological specificity factor MinE [Capsulimonadales bacterium]
MASFLERLLGRGDTSARATAKKRLQVVIMHDRADISPPMLEQMRREILVVLSKYVDIDEAMLDVNLERENDTVALVANIPILRVHTEV